MGARAPVASLIVTPCWASSGQHKGSASAASATCGFRHEGSDAQSASRAAVKRVAMNPSPQPRADPAFLPPPPARTQLHPPAARLAHPAPTYHVFYQGHHVGAEEGARRAQLRGTSEPLLRHVSAPSSRPFCGPLCPPSPRSAPPDRLRFKVTLGD